MEQLARYWPNLNNVKVQDPGTLCFVVHILQDDWPSKMQRTATSPTSIFNINLSTSTANLPHRHDFFPKTRTIESLPSISQPTNMKPARALIAILISHVILIHHLVSGLVTLQTIRDITNVTEECRGRITGKDIEEGMQVVVGLGGVEIGGQNILSTGHGSEDGEDVEDVSSGFPLLNHSSFDLNQFKKGKKTFGIES